MKKLNHTTNWFFKILVLLGISVFFLACSTNVKKFEYSATANPTDEIRNLKADMEKSEGNQIAVFAPKSYAEANEHWMKARDLKDKGAANEKVLAELGTARGFYEKAKTVAETSSKSLSDVVNARENALLAGAAMHQRDELKKTDRILMGVTEDFETKTPDVAATKKVELQKEYLNIELDAVKANRLGDVRANLEGAKKNGAVKYAPQTYEAAQQKYKAAEMTIETDRHNDQLITSTSDEAMKAAMKALKVTQIAKHENLQGKENVALDLFNKEQNINSLNQQKMTAEQQAQMLKEQNQNQQQNMQSQAAQMQASNQAQLSEAERKAANATSALDAKTRFEKVYADAQKKFSPEEAEVYRQGDNLILRMKSVQFPSGRTELPANSYSALNRVKEVIKDMNASKVTVEGHTDSSGKADANKKLSQARAESVAQFIKDPAASESIEAKGYGYERPLTTNKTKEGRAQNRRVDIVIQPDTNSSGSSNQ